MDRMAIPNIYGHPRIVNTTCGGFVSDQLQAVVSRLDGVRKSRKGFTARCPAHEDQSASLSIADGEHGVVVRCFAGCATDDVLGAIGLTFSDLYPPRERGSMTPEQRSHTRLAVQQAGWAAALTTLASDVLTVEAVAGMLATGHPLAQIDLDALSAARQRIHYAKETLCGRR